MSIHILVFILLIVSFIECKSLDSNYFESYYTHGTPVSRSQSGRPHDNSQKTTEEKGKDEITALSVDPVDKERLPLMPLSNAKTVLSFMEFIVQKALSLMNQQGQKEYEAIGEAMIKLSSDEHHVVAEVKQQPSSDKD